ncbi:T9SS type A sorting domain-containing protein [bacterium]|nr:T9SS type A sorting domain-containing protein [bacterium]
MRKHATAIILMLLLVGGLLAQGVAITQPIDGLTTADEDQLVSYVFSAPEDIDQATVVLSVDGTDYTIGAGLEWTIVNLIYDIVPGVWTEGVHTLSLSALDLVGDPVIGTPLETEFNVDLSAPYMSARTPGVIDETEPILTTDVLEPISVTITDDFGVIDPASIVVEIKDIPYTMASVGVTLTAVDGGYLFEFDPATAGIAWEENDWVTVELMAAQDAPHYGASNVAVPGPEFGFFVDADGPECFPVEPIPFVRDIIWTGCSDLQLTWRIIDENGLDLSSFYIMVNDVRYNWGNYRMVVDTLDSYEVYTVIDSVTTDTTEIVNEVVFTFSPNPQWYEGVVFTVFSPVINDIYGNPATDWDWGAYSWTSWKLRFDNTGPAISNPVPVPSYVTRDLEESISWDMTDTWGAVDPSTVHFIIETSGGEYIEYDAWNAVTTREITYDGLTMTYYPNMGGIAWLQGDTITVTIWDVMDSTEFCDANHLSHPSFSWTFYVADGPMADNLIPGVAEFTSCQAPQISFELIDPDGINPTSVLFQVEDVIFDVNYDITVIETVAIIGGHVITETTEVFPFYQDISLPSRFLLDMALVPPSLINFTDAMEVNCTILEAMDWLANPLWGGPHSWRFWVDYSGPFAGSTMPADGGIAGGPYPVFSIDVLDAVCGMVDPNGVSVQLRGVNFNPLIDPGVFWEDIFGGGRITIDTEIEGFYYDHGSVVNVCLNEAYDNPNHRCGIWGNIALDLPYCWSFTVDNHVPAVEVVEPLNMTVSACPMQPIVIEITDDYGVDPTMFRMTVNHVVIDWGDPRLTWDGTYLSFTPTEDYPEGLVTWALNRLSDVAGNIDDETPLSGGFYADYTAPAITLTDPLDGSTAIVVPEFLKIGTDDMAGLDPLFTQFVIDVYTDETTFVTYIVDEATFPGVFIWDADLNELWLDMAVAGITFDFEVYRVMVSIATADAPEYACPDPNILGLYQYEFFVNPGWMVDLEYWCDESTMVDVYGFGAFFGGTEEYDAGLDELLPPFPPTETPLSFLTPGAGTPLRQDYLGLDSDTWEWTMYTGSQSGCIHWDPTALPALGSFVINGTVDMLGTGEYCFEPGEVILINVTRRVMMVAGGWNLISVPVAPVDPSIEAVFPMVNPADIWEYTGGTPPYVHPAIVHPGRAYMVLYTPGPEDPDPCYFTVPGIPITEYTVDLIKGWNTIGSVYDFGGVSFLDPDDTPDGSCEPIVYYLDPAAGSYAFSDVIVAGMGYWNLVDPPAPFLTCELTVSASYARGAKALPGFEGEPEWTTTMNFAGDAVREITIGGHAEATAEYERGLDIPIPPALPGATFDVYIEGTKYGRLIKDIRNSDGWTIVVNSQTPVEFTWTGNAPEGLILEGMGQEIDLNVDGRAILDPGTYTAKRRVEVPSDYALKGAAPNPFNAACGITFDIPSDSKVTLEVFDMMGRKISTVADGDFAPGTHRVIWNGNDDYDREVSSGVYFYRMNAGDFKASGRMVLIR